MIANRVMTHAGDVAGLRNIGPFRVHEVLGSGGMGVVYRATHQKTGEEVALKTLQVITRALLTGIRQEIHALTCLRHPGVVRIVSAGIADGLPWYAMELLKGQTLRAHLSQGRYTDLTGTVGAVTRSKVDIEAPSQSKRPVMSGPTGATSSEHLAISLRVIRQLCAPLAYIHGQGIVHCDLKPENIFIQDEEPILVDLGVSSQFMSEGGREPLSPEGHVAGSLSYMAPEQRFGELVDARADLYALGVILYESVTGRLPSSQPDIDSLLASVPDISPELLAIISKLLASRPADRFGYAEDVARALEQVSPTKLGGTTVPVTNYVYRSDLVGRSEIVRNLDHAITNLVREKRGGALFLRGESGSGKTRLAVEATKFAARRRVTVVTCQCTTIDVETTPEGRRPTGGPLEVLREVLVAAADRAQELGAEEVERLFGPRIRILAQYEPTVAALASDSTHPEPPPTPPQEARAQVIAAFGEVVLALADMVPLLLVIDDLQWIDELSLAALSWLLTAKPDDLPLLVLGAFRSEGLIDELAELLDSDGASVIDVPRLDGRGVQEMVAGMLALQDPPRALVDFVIQNTEGNPFFVAEYLRTAISDGALERASTGQWRLNARFADEDTLQSEHTQPRSLAALIDRRLRGLDDGSRSVVEWGGLLGREFDSDLISAGTSLDETELVETLRELRLRHILEEPSSGRLRFVHDKIREGAYERIPLDRRRALHKQAAFVLEDHHEGSADIAPTLAHHFERADLYDCASHWYGRAATRAREAYANKEAISHYREALASSRRFRAADSSATPSLPLSPDEQLLEATGDLLAISGRQSDAKDTLFEAIEFLAPDDCIARSRLYRKAGKAAETLHDHDEALRCYGLAEQVLSDDSTKGGEWFSEWFEVQMAHTWVYYWLAHLDELTKLIEKVRPVVERRAGPVERGHFFQSIMHMELRRDRYVASARTVEFAHASMAASIESGDANDICAARFALGFTLLFHGDFDGAEETLECAIVEAERLGDLPTQTRCLTYLMMTHRLRGNLDETKELADRVLEIANTGKMVDYCGAARANLGWVAFRRGEARSATEALNAAIENWHSVTYEYPFQWMSRLPLISQNCEAGQAAGARAHARVLLDAKQQQLHAGLTAALEAGIAEPDHNLAIEKFLLAVRQARAVGFM